MRPLPSFGRRCDPEIFEFIPHWIDHIRRFPIIDATDGSTALAIPLRVRDPQDLSGIALEVPVHLKESGRFKPLVAPPLPADSLEAGPDNGALLDGLCILDRPQLIFEFSDFCLLLSLTLRSPLFERRDP